MAGNNIHSQITDEDEIHVPKGFTEANNSTVAIKNGLGQLEWTDVDDLAHKSNLDATVNPTENDDVSLEYSVGSRWINVVQKIAYVCLDATDGAAIWRPLVRNKGDAVVDPTINDDMSLGYLPGSVWINVADGREAWLCTDSTVGAAEWKSLTEPDVVGIDHRTLSHLDADDHLQYLNRDGSRPMIAELDMDGNAIINVPEINGFTVPGHNTRVVKVDPGTSEYGSVAAAVASITDSSITNPYVVVIGPGVFDEPAFSVPSYVHLVGSGVDITVLQPTVTNTVFITVDRNTSLSNMSLTGATGTNGVLIDFVPSATGTRCLLHILRFGQSETVFRCINPGFDCAFIAIHCGTSRTNTFKKVFHIETNTSAVVGLVNGGTYLQGTNDAQAVTFDISGTGADITLLGMMSRYPVGALGTHVSVYDGSTLTVNGLALEGGSTGLSAPNIGSGPTLNATGVISFTPTVAADIQHPGFNGAITGNASVATSLISPAVTDLSLIITDPNGSQYISGVLNTRQPDGGFTDTTTLSVNTSAMGLLTSGAITPTGGRNLSIAPGLGYLQKADNSIKKVIWLTATYEVPANSTKFLYVDEDNLIQAADSLPDTRQNVFLGRVVSNSVAIVLVDASGFSSYHVSNAIGDMLRESIGAIYVTGSNVTELGVRTLDITAGAYFFGELEYLTQGGSPVSFASFYQDGGGDYIHVLGQTVVDNSFYDNGSGTLAPLTAGYYTKHSLYTVGTCTGGFANEGYYLVYGQAQYSDLALVEQGGLPSPPSFLTEGVSLIASVIVQEGFANLVQIRDERPITSARRTSQVAASTFHHNLVGLNDFDDHLRYLPVDGSRPMEADLDMDGWDIVDAGTINGVMVEDHSDRHRPGGADAIPTAAAATVAPDQANAEGISLSLSRADHVHNVPTATAIGMGANTSSSQGVSTSFSRADHQHAIASATAVTQTPDQANATGTSAGFARADHVHNIATAVAVGLTGNSTNGQGLSTSFSRADHTHLLLTGAPSSQAPDQANATGTASAMARADHIHNIPTAIAIGMGANTVNAQGAAATFSRSDHQHAIASGVVSTQQADQVNAAGTSSNFARADHIHNIPTGTPVSLTPDLANAQGTSLDFAKADHIHNIPADAPTTTLSPATSNAEGAGTSFARNDHTHAVATALVADIVTIQPDDTASAGTANTYARGDHRHAIAAAAPSSQTPDQANAEGVSTSFARADHVHNIPADAPTTTLSPATTNTEGVGTSFARNDHTHAVATALVADITTIQPDDAAAAGTANTFARGDHKHAIVAAAGPTNSANANTEGVATSFSRSDHGHQITAGTATIDQLAQFDGTNWQAINPENWVNPSRAFYILDDFTSGAPSGVVAGGYGWSPVINGGGSAITMDTTLVVSNRAGIVNITSGTAAARYANLSLAQNHVLGGGTITIGVAFRITTTTNANYRIGLGDIVTNADHNNGVYLEYNSATSANWLIKTASGGTRTSTTTATAAAANTWHYLLITINAAATSISYSLNGVSLGTITTNIPTAATGPVLLANSLSGTTSTLFVDYFEMRQRFTTPR